MALKDDIRAKIQKLEQEEHQMMESHLCQIQQLEKEFHNEAAQIYRQMKNLIQEREKLALEEFNDHMLQLRQQVDDRFQQYVMQQQRLETHNRREREKIVQELQKEREILEKRIEKIDAYYTERSDIEKRRAMELLEQLKEVEVNVLNSPHQVFCGNQFDVIALGRENIEHFLQDGMYQAVSGQAAMMIADYQLLAAKTDQKYREWEVLYRRFSALLQTIWGQVNSFNQSRLTTPFAQYVLLTDVEKDFWSQGEYRWMMRYLDEANGLESQIGWEGIEQYLKSQAAYDVDKMTDLYYDMREEKNHIYAILNCINNERFYSDQRYVWGEKIVNILKESDYNVIERYWEEASESMRVQQWYQASHKYADDYAENQLGTYAMTFEFGYQDYLHVKIVPIREYGICVRNQCYLMVDMNSAKNAQSTQNIIVSNCQRISVAIDAHVISCGESMTAYDNAEKNAKKLSSIKEQQKYLNLISGRRG